MTGQPPKKLIGFAKTFVQAGQTRQVRISIDPESTHHPFGVWDYCTRACVTPPGDHIMYVGSSADDTPHVMSVPHC